MDIRYLCGYEFISDEKFIPKEACDVQFKYSSIFPPSVESKLLSSKLILKPQRQTYSLNLTSAFSQSVINAAVGRQVSTAGRNEK